MASMADKMPELILVAETDPAAAPMHNIVARLEALVSVVSTGVAGWLA
jgi:hypothetical protein